jgi:hypothetical protein
MLEHHDPITDRDIAWSLAVLLSGVEGRLGLSHRHLGLAERVETALVAAQSGSNAPLGYQEGRQSMMHSTYFRTLMREPSSAGAG